MELDWSIVDANFEDLFPGQRYRSSCRFTGLAQRPVNAGQGDNQAATLVPVDIQLQIRLRVFDCPLEEDLALCERGEPVREQIFDCDLLRGTIAALESREQPYLFVVDTLLTPVDQPAFYPSQSCVATPGPRSRRIRPGQITNLAVYQIALQASPDRPLRIDNCAQAARTIDHTP